MGVAPLVLLACICAINSLTVKDLAAKSLSLHQLTQVPSKHIKHVISSVLISSALLSTNAVLASEGDMKPYVNERYHTKLSYPSDWIVKEGTVSGDRSLQAFVDPNDADTSAALVFTPIPADYNRLSAFGGKDRLRDYMIPQGEGVTTDIVGETLKGETYCVEYVVTLPEGVTRHVQTVFSLRPKDAIVGLTVQTKQDTYDKNKAKLSLIVPSLQVELD
jgi:PsbP